MVHAVVRSMVLRIRLFRITYCFNPRTTIWMGQNGIYHHPLYFLTAIFFCTVFFRNCFRWHDRKRFQRLPTRHMFSAMDRTCTKLIQITYQSCKANLENPTWWPPNRYYTYLSLYTIQSNNYYCYDNNTAQFVTHHMLSYEDIESQIRRQQIGNTINSGRLIEQIFFSSD